eukprot:s2035_g14.t3
MWRPVVLDEQLRRLTACGNAETFCAKMRKHEKANVTSDSCVSWLACRKLVHGITGRCQSIDWICHLGSNSGELFLRRAFVPVVMTGAVAAHAPRAQARIPLLLAAALSLLVIRFGNSVWSRSFVSAPGPSRLPQKAETSHVALSSSQDLPASDGWYMMPLGVPKVPCNFVFRGSRTDLASKQALDACVSELLEGFGLEREQRERDDERQTVTCIGIMRGLGSQVGYGNNTRRVCWATPNMNLTSLSCEALNDVAWELMIAALRHLALCSGLYGEIPEDSLEAWSKFSPQAKALFLDASSSFQFFDWLI